MVVIGPLGMLVDVPSVWAVMQVFVGGGIWSLRWAVFFDFEGSSSPYLTCHLGTLACVLIFLRVLPFLFLVPGLLIDL